MKKVFFVILLSYLFVGTVCSANEKGNQVSVRLVSQIQENLKKQTYVFAKKEYEEFVLGFWEDTIPKQAVKNKEITMGAPFIEYEPDRGQEQLLYVHYPVFLQGKTFGIFTVAADDDKKMTIQELSEPSMPSDKEKMLDKMNYQGANIIFYKKGNQIIAESEKGQWKYADTLDSSRVSQKEQSFAEKSWQEKAKEIGDNTKKLVKYEFPEREDDNTAALENIPQKMKQKIQAVKKKREEKRQMPQIRIALAGGVIFVVGMIAVFSWALKRKKN